VHGLCRSLVKQGADVSVFTTNIDQNRDLDVPLNKPVDMDGVKVYYYPVMFPRRYCYSGQLGDAIREHIPEFDIVHIHSVYLYPTTIACRWCRRYKKPYILNPFGALDPSMIKLRSSFKKQLYIRLIESRTINSAKVIHVASLYEKHNYETLGFKTPAVVIPRGIDLSEYPLHTKDQYLVKKYPFLSGKKIILFLGRIHPKKGLDLLAGAFKKIVDMRDDVFLIIAGSGDQSYVSQIKQLFKKKGLSDHVLFTGMLLDFDKLSAFYGSNMFILPSYGENFGIAVLEAMACALPVVITNKVGLSPDVKECRAGIVTNCDQEEIAEAMLELFNNENAGKAMGESGRKLVEDRFTDDEAARRAMIMYKEVITNE
jgi:glycosyltransferase involved in cell wall biosynthesis